MEQTYHDWVPQLILREPCEYASVIAQPPGQAVTAQVAISLAEAEAASIVAAGPLWRSTAGEWSTSCGPARI